MKKFKLIIPLLLIVVFVCCGRKSEELAPPQVVTEIAAIVNNKEIPLQNVNNLFNQLSQAHKDYYLHKKGRRSFLEDLIDRELIFQAAMKERSTGSPEEAEKTKNELSKLEVLPC